MDPENYIKGFQLNILQKLFNHYDDEKVEFLQLIMTDCLDSIGIFDFNKCITIYGSKINQRIAKRMSNFNLVLSQAFESLAQFQATLDKRPDSWWTAPLGGHSMSNNIYEISRTEAELLADKGIVNLSQVLLLDDLGRLTRNIDNTKLQNLNISTNLINKIKNLHSNIKDMPGDVRSRIPVGQTHTNLLFTLEYNVSIYHKKLCFAIHDEKQKIAPAYLTRLEDNIPVPNEQIFTDAYNVVLDPILSSKTKENSFQILNRTIWTRNKAYKSGRIDSPYCLLCNKIETIEHLFVECEKYSFLRWETLAKYISTTLRYMFNKTDITVRFDLSSILYNSTPFYAFATDVKRNIKDVIQHLIHENRRDIYRRNQNFVEYGDSRTTLIHIKAHCISAAKKLYSFYKYLNNSRHEQVMEFLLTLINNIAAND